MATATEEPKARTELSTIIGQVSSAKTAKTIKVVVQYLTKHAKYGKYLKRSSVYHVHDEAGEAREGDTVEIAECRPYSRTKHHRLVRVVTKAPEKITHDTGDAITGASGVKQEEQK
ncbi:MAG: 30S ribosomal protein S17 [Tepidisphaeraceae bacterium]